MRSTVSVVTYRDDPLYPRVQRAVAAILDNGKVVAPVDVLVGLGLLAPEKLDDWRHGRIPYLARIFHTPPPGQSLVMVNELADCPQGRLRKS